MSRDWKMARAAVEESLTLRASLAQLATAQITQSGPSAPNTAGSPPTSDPRSSASTHTILKLSGYRKELAAAGWCFPCLLICLLLYSCFVCLLINSCFLCLLLYSCFLCLLLYNSTTLY